MHTKMKELRFRHGKEVGRVAFAFDPSRQAVLAVAGDKAGADQRLFYTRLIDRADIRLAHHLVEMNLTPKEKHNGKKLDDVLSALPVKRQTKITQRAANLATLRDLRLTASQTHADMAQALGVRQDTISCLEQRSEMLPSTMRRYVEAMGGQLEIVVTFPNRPSVKLAHLADISG